MSGSDYGRNDTSDRRRFSVGDRARVVASAAAGDLMVTVGEHGTVEVVFPGGGAEHFRIQHSGDRVTVRPHDRRRRLSHVPIEITVPPESDLKLSSVSGDIEVLGPAGDVDINVVSGDVHVDGTTGSVHVKSASGDVDLGDTADVLDVTTVSGDIQVGDAAGSTSISTASGDLRVDHIDDVCSLNTVSGDVVVRTCDAEELTIRTMSGDLFVGLPARRKIDLEFESIAGDLRNDIQQGSGEPPESSISIRCRSVSGDLTLRSAAQ